ncbi:MAG: ATP-binding protein [Verrucomicrobiota bacterium]
MDIEQHPFFKKVPSEKLSGLLKASSVQRFGHEVVIFEEGSPSDALYLILEGRVAFRKRLPTKHLLTISISDAGGFFGEIGVLTHEPRALRAEAYGDCELVRIPHVALLRFLEEMPGPVESLLQSVIHHLHYTTRHYVDDMVHQEKMAVVGSMMNTIVHDFKNPFCLISMSAQLLRQRHSDEQTVRLCRNVEEQVERMVTMAADLAEYSRGEYRLTPMPVDLRSVVDEFRSLNLPFFEADNVTIEVDVPPLRVMAEKNKLMRVLQNLVSNAFDALQDRTDGHITLSAKRSPDAKSVVLRIADNGEGIPESIRERFFEPFITYGKSGGTGLGSAIAKSIIEAHGGSIHFETVSGEGTVFYITLAAAQA